MQALEFFELFVKPLESEKISYFVTGSVASIIYGDPRLTHDIDIVIHLTFAEVSKLSQMFPEDQYYCPPEEVIQIELNRKGFAHLNVIHHQTGLKADLYPDVGEPLHAWSFQNRKRIEISHDIQIWVAPPEYVIIRKLEYFRQGGSQKHLEDIRKIFNVSGETLDLSFLEKEIQNRSLVSEWNQIHFSKDR